MMGRIKSRLAMPAVAVIAAAAGPWIGSAAHAQQVAPGTTVVTPRTTQVVPGGTVVTPGAPQVVPGGTVVTPGAPQAAPVAPNAPQVQSVLNDALFAAAATAGGLAELATSQLAVQRAESEEVKQFAQRMIADHSRANQELAVLAATKGIALPANLDLKDHAVMDQLYGLTGAEFDRAYMEYQVAAHMGVVALFRAESQRGQDADLKAFAAKTLPTLQEHLQMARQFMARSRGGEAGPAGTDAAPQPRSTPQPPDRTPQPGDAPQPGSAPQPPPAAPLPDDPGQPAPPTPDDPGQPAPLPDDPGQPALTPDDPGQPAPPPDDAGQADDTGEVAPPPIP